MISQDSSSSEGEEGLSSLSESQLLKLSESDVGPEVTHVYQIENKGPSDILEAQVYILWPSFRPNGDPLLYLMHQPTVEGKGRCDYVSDVNIFQIKVSLGFVYLL